MKEHEDTPDDRGTNSTTCFNPCPVRLFCTKQEDKVKETSNLIDRNWVHRKLRKM